MEYTMKKYEGNKVFNGSSDLLELFACMTTHEHQSLKTLPYVTEYQLLSWYWNKAFEISNFIPVLMKIRLHFEDVVYQHKCDKVQSKNDEIIFNFNAINILHSGFHSRKGILIPFKNFNVLAGFTESMGDSVDELNSSPSQEYNILLPSYDVEYASKFYSLRKIDSFFNNFDFKGSRILEPPELFPEFKDISVESCPQKAEECNVIFASSSTSKLISSDKEKSPDSICTNFCETCFASKRTNSSEKIQNCYLVISNIKSHSVKSRDYLVDLMKTYKHLCFPIKRRINAFQKPKVTLTNRLCNVFTKNRQFSGNYLYHNHQCSKRYYFAKDLTHTTADASISVSITENGNNHSSCIQDNFIDQELSGKQVKSKIAEIRQKIENLTRGVNSELIRREQYHTSFIEQCKRISDSLISSNDYNEIYHSKSSQNKVKVSCRDDICDFNLSDLHETANTCYEVLHRSKTLNSPNRNPRQNDYAIPHSQAFNPSKVPNSRDHVRNKALNSQKHLLKQSEDSGQKNASYLKNFLENFRHQIAVALSTISVPFVTLLFSKT